MTPPNLSQIVADVWEETLRETPDPFRRDNIFCHFWGEPSPSYRERLDRQPINFYGELIPRIVTVRRNIRKTKGYKKTW